MKCLNSQQFVLQRFLAPALGDKTGLPLVETTKGSVPLRASVVR